MLLDFEMQFFDFNLKVCLILNKFMQLAGCAIVVNGPKLLGSTQNRFFNPELDPNKNLNL